MHPDLIKRNVVLLQVGLHGFRAIELLADIPGELVKREVVRTVWMIMRNPAALSRCNASLAPARGAPKAG